MDEPKSVAALAEAEHRRGELDPPPAALVGAEPIENIVMMEDHHEAYYAWKQVGFRGRVLLHIDAHIDWDWIPDKDPQDILQAQSIKQVEALLAESGLWNLSKHKGDELIHIGNYIYPALQKGIVREFYCVLPDDAMDTPKARADTVAMFEDMRKVNPERFKVTKLEGKRIIAEIFGKQVTTCSLADLPEIQEPVLLDIDTDFLLSEPGVSARAGVNLWNQVPWIWPEELIARLKDKGIRTDFVTIAYSVEEGYTPLSYKYLGDELALRLKHPTMPAHHCERLAHKRRGARFRSCNELNHAITEFEQARDLAPEDASTHFNLAHLYDEKGAYDQAAAHYRQAVQLDPTYGTEFNNFGSLYQSLGNLDRARDEYLRILRWDSRHAYAQDGLAETLARQKRWDEAIACYQKVMELRPDHGGAYRGLGYVYAKQGRWEEAVQPLNKAIALHADDVVAHWWLAEARFHQRRWDEALEAYRGALSCGLHSVTVYRRLGSLYLRKRNFYKAFTQYRRALRLQGRLAQARIRRIWRTLLCSP